ncbi:MAG TPA: nucleotidyltransferase domain-containing protein [Lacisediminihabitans sp.]|uniref:nucleotidyltransferase family protein n=1 Tax=Lacisediminihabitans sp. TaxID=2787631 RepID=UPI002ED9E08B
MDTPEPEAVTSVADARASLSQILRRFRSSHGTAPIIFGSHRQAEAVLLPYGRYRELAADRGKPRPPVLEQLRSRRALVVRLAALNRIRAVAVFGSVARGEETETSDIDLLVEPEPDASLFDLAQFGIDLEQVFTRAVDVVSSSALIAGVDADIREQSVPL